MIQSYFDQLRKKLGLSDDIPANEIITSQRQHITSPFSLLRLLIKEAQTEADMDLIDLLAD